MMSPLATWCWLLVSLLDFTSLLIDGVEISIPLKFRSEGRLTLIYLHDNKTIKQHLAFSESVDSIRLESAISIGHVAYTPSKYHTKDGSPTITVNSDGICSSFPSDASAFLPEFSWFLDLLLPRLKPSQSKVVAHHMVGPSGLLAMLVQVTKDVPFENFTPQTVHRNIPCDIYARNYKPPSKEYTLRFEIYMPAKGIQFGNSKASYFTIKAMTTFVDTSANRPDNVSLIIDYFNIESMDNASDKFDKMRDDFNLPLASGCSEFMEQVLPDINAKSFSIDYRQRSSSNSILMAFDHASGFLRREIHGTSVSIWDLNEDLMYHINTNMTNMIDQDTELSHDHMICSVLQVTDEKLGPAYRPYDRVGESLDVLKMIGATKVAYMGRGTVRDLPCTIYETILPEAPNLFALTGERKGNKSSEDRDYIVQFYLLQGDSGPGPVPGLSPFLTEAGFWPAKIMLYRRSKESKQVKYIDQLDIYDFFWSLDGWNKKGNELFMASECFDDEDEQIRLELALTFDRVHQGAVKPEDKKLLPFNKYKLEFDLLNDIFGLLDASKMHLVEYKLQLRPHHVDLNMIIGDRSEDKILTYFGTGKRLDPSNYSAKNQIILTQMTEENCVTTGSLLREISLILYCPSYQGQYSVLGSMCIILTNEEEPIVEAEMDPQKPVCEVYRFTPSSVTKRGTVRVNDNKSKLIGHQFDFVAQMPGGGAKDEILKGVVKTYDISHDTPLFVIGHYMFPIDPESDIGSNSSGRNKLLANQKVRAFNSYTYSSLGDCVRICNLDVNCRSYSYCSYTPETPCVLSSLDIRASRLQDQLVHSLGPLEEGTTIDVSGDRGDNYTLKFLDNCAIYERDYLNMFRQTEEVIRLQRKLANQFRTAATTFECAKHSVDLELNSPNHHVAMFAYCATSNTCLLDENLFAPTNEASSIGSTSGQAKGGDGGELLCRVYRKKYQTYFNVSAKVLSRQPSRQIELEFGTVEECSRACWNKFGQVCASFDYCSPNSCLINQIHMESSEAELETRPNCLHYERDLRIDELRRQHMIGRHELLQDQKESRTFGGVLLSIINYFLVFCAFVYGLVLGRQVNDKMEAVSILRQSISAGSGQQMSRYAGSANSLNDDDEQANFDNMPDPFGSNTIRLSVIKSGNGNDNQPLDQDF